MRRIVVIDPSGPAPADLLTANCEALSGRGFEVELRLYPNEAGHRLSPDGIQARAALLTDALCEAETSVILCARGGYGASDLLDRIPWRHLGQVEPKLVCGFSDISALQIALYLRLGWPGVHGPMPGSGLWQDAGADVNLLLELFRRWPGPMSGCIELVPESAGEASGVLVGGCYTVLGDLLGSRHFPPIERDHILFLEDVNESAPRLLRNWNQWLQTGMTRRLRAIVLGRFVHRDERERPALNELVSLLQARCDCPVFQSPEFGHIAPNLPLMIGAHARIGENRLDWSWPSAGGGSI